MRRTFLLLLTVILSTVAMAENVTSEQALEQARNFIQKREADGSRPRRGASAAQQLGQAKQVSGLYVFNIANNGGFVIVSNDDVALPILGYSDSGSIDPDNMPENMKAWLQGYADEIAWAKANNITVEPIASNRTNRAVKTAIAPLVQTHWNQGEPYNNLVNSTTYFPLGDAVTGCVATAMAQVMYYTAKKAGLSSSYTLAATDSYNTSYGCTIPVVPANTALNWSQMLTEYTFSYNSTTKKYDIPNYTDDQGNAVATLMKACGASVRMNYANSANGGSSASSTRLPNALKTYFGYDETTQFASRSYYSYRNWIDLLYNELSQERPILYSGQSTGGGHEFVCDGYQSEDYFHINWGWGGTSDGFFKLAALDPNEQGIGGSSSTDGYNFGQDAIIGIQLDGGTGTVLDIANTVSLTLNSVATDKTSMTTDETANITFNITNTSSDDYDGEIGFFFIDQGLGDGKMFLIPAGQTKDCVIEFNPTSTGTYKISAYKPTIDGGYSFINSSQYVTVTVTAGSGSGSNPTTNNITLERSLAVETTELVSDPKTYNVYGQVFKAELTIKNPNPTYDYKGTYQIDLYENNDWANPVIRQVQVIRVPANGSITIPVEYEGMIIDKVYELDVVYIKNDDWTDFDEVGYYTCKPGITVYNTDGTKTTIKATSSYITPAGALAVDISEAGVTTVTKNSNPNCLYILKTTDAVPTGLTNIIKYDGSAYTATNITLTDGNDFYSPVDFTATNIEFTYNNDRCADGTSGWNTIMLPFDVTSVTANGTAIDWFHSSSDTDKQFWLKEFVDDGVGSVTFNFTSAMKANTPYIIALPGNHWGTAYDLSGKTIKFIGSGEVKKSAQTVVTGSNYRFIGNTQAVSTENIYCINAAGNAFDLKASGGSAAFRPFFKADIFDRAITSLAINSGGAVTGINEIEDVRSKKDDVYYDLNGRRVLYPKKGVYVVNGKKVVIK